MKYKLTRFPKWSLPVVFRLHPQCCFQNTEVKLQHIKLRTAPTLEPVGTPPDAATFYELFSRSFIHSANIYLVCIMHQRP